MNRFDIPETVKNVIHAAIKHEVLDAVDIYAMATRHGDDYIPMISEIVDAAYCCIHFNSDAHKAVAEAADEFHKEIYSEKK